MSGDPAAAHDVLARELIGRFPIDAARVLERLSPEEAAALLADVSAEEAASALGAMVAPCARPALAALPADDAAAIAAELPAPQSAGLLRGADAGRIEAVLGGLARPRAEAIRAALAQRAGTVGALADPDVLVLASDATAADALERLRARRGVGSDRVFVVARDGRLAGVVGLAAVVGASLEARLADLMQAEVVSVVAEDDAAVIAQHPGWVRWRSLPVVDADGRFVGVLRFEAVQHWLLATPAGATTPASLSVSFAELLWLGLTSFTDGLAHAVAARVDAQTADGREGGPHEDGPREGGSDAR